MTLIDPATPVAPGFLGFGALAEIERDPLQYFVRVAKHGDAVSTRIGPFEVVQLTHPDHHREVLVDKHRAFRKSRRVKRVLEQWSGDGLALIDGEPWVRLRRLVSPAFRSEVTAQHVTLVERHASRLVASWAGATEVDVARDVARLTFAVVAEALFGSDVEPYVDDFAALVATLGEHAIHELSSMVVWPMWMPTPRKRSLRHAAEGLAAIVYEMIARARRSGGGRRDLLALLIEATDDDGSRLDDRQLHDAAVNILLGGNETTATAIVWTLHDLAFHEEAQDVAAREALDEARAISAQRSFSHVEAALKESMRLHPPAYALPREAAEDVVVAGHRIRRGALVNLVPYVTHRDPRWFVDPERFAPGRFRESDVPPGAYLPFGLGPRACIGRGFAMMEALVVLRALLGQLAFRPLPGAGPAVEEARISLHPKGGLRLAVGPRAGASGTPAAR